MVEIEYPSVRKVQLKEGVTHQEGSLLQILFLSIIGFSGYNLASLTPEPIEHLCVHGGCDEPLSEPVVVLLLQVQVGRPR